jgi:hypothetical protein
LNPGNQQAIASSRRLEPIVAERREKLKEEMLGMFLHSRYVKNYFDC